MDLTLTEEQRLIQQTAREFAERELIPQAAERDAAGVFPERELKQLGELGLLGVTVPEEYGGSAAGAVAYSLAMMELARGDASVSVAVSVTNMVADLVCMVGSEEQKRAHVQKLIDGTYLCGSFALSEPQAGSDPAAMTARAVKTATGWRLNGTKQWITSGDHAGLIIVWAITDPDAGRKGISAFLVRGNAPGLSVGRVEHKMGLRGSSTVQLALDDVDVADGDLLGKAGDGFKLAMMALDGGRIGISSQAVGVARGALELAVAYSKERTQFGVPIAQHQAVGNMLADSATWIEAARLLTLEAAWRKERGLPHTKQASIAKVFASEKACRVCDIAIQVYGGYGYTTDYPVERMYRDVRVTMIYEGTSEIQRIVIARELMKEADSYE